MSSIPVPPPSVANTYAVGIIWAVVSILIVGLRFYARKQRKAPILLDDWLVVPAAAIIVGMCTVVLYGVIVKSLAHPTPQPPPNVNPLNFQSFENTVAKKLTYSITLLQTVNLTCTKLSCLFFYRRVLNTGQNRSFNLLTWTVIGIVSLWGVAFFFANMFWCRGHFTAWWGSIKNLGTHCPNALNIQLAYAASDLFTDVIVILVPIPTLMRLQLSLTRKIGLIGVFALGALTVAASIVRLIVYAYAIAALKKNYRSSGANNSVVTTGLYWDIVESGLALLGVCIPTLYTLLSRVLPSEQHGSDNYGRRRDNSISHWSRHQKFDILQSFRAGKASEESLQDLDLEIVGNTSDTGPKVSRGDQIIINNEVDMPEGQILVQKTIKLTKSSKDGSKRAIESKSNGC